MVAKAEKGTSKGCFNDPSLIDPELHPVGIMQAEAGQTAVIGIDWEVVFVSPMQRTMMTTIHMFKNHPNKANIRFVVLPIVRECMNTTNDIAIDCDELMTKFAEGTPATCGIVFDFSRMFLYGIPQLWQIFTISNVEK